jgi:hypothetical protein
MKMRLFIFCLALLALSPKHWEDLPASKSCQEENPKEESNTYQIDVNQVFVSSVSLSICAPDALDWMPDFSNLFWFCPLQTNPKGYTSSPRFDPKFLKAFVKGYVVKNAP